MTRGSALLAQLELTTRRLEAPRVSNAELELTAYQANPIVLIALLELTAHQANPIVLIAQLELTVQHVIAPAALAQLDLPALQAEANALSAWLERTAHRTDQLARLAQLELTVANINPPVKRFAQLDSGATPRSCHLLAYVAQLDLIVLLDKPRAQLAQLELTEIITAQPLALLAQLELTTRRSEVPP